MKKMLVITLLLLLVSISFNQNLDFTNENLNEYLSNIPKINYILPTNATIKNANQNNSDEIILFKEEIREYMSNLSNLINLSITIFATIFTIIVASYNAPHCQDTKLKILS